MPPDPQEISCPRFPDHGPAIKRWLPPEDRDMVKEDDTDVFEIDCPMCGKYEYQDEGHVEG